MVQEFKEFYRIVMKNLALISAGRRVSLLKAFKKELGILIPESKIFAVDSNPELSAACSVSDAQLKICNATENGYIEALLDLCLKNNIGLIIPTIDTELYSISKNIDLFHKHGIFPVISKNGIIQVLNDKVRTGTFFSALGISTPKLYSKEDYKLPLFLKPINGSNSVDNHVIIEHEDFTENYFKNDEILFFEYIDHNLNEEYTVDMYYSREGLLKCAVPRLRMEVRGGEVNKSLTSKNHLLLDCIYGKMSSIPGLKGCVSAQFFMNKHNNSIIGIEINARFGGGFPLSYSAGANYPSWIIKEYLLDQEIPIFNDWQDNLLMLRYDDEILVDDYKSG